MKFSNCKKKCPETEEVDCGEETCQEAICRHDAYISELFARTDWLKGQLTGAGIGPFMIAYSADSGINNDDQTAMAASMAGHFPDIYLFGGDNNYPSGEQVTLENNWAAFSSPISQNVVFPALGNHDMDTSPLGDEQTTKFSYLPNNKRYYHIFFQEGSVDIFVLNSGLNTARVSVEPDGFVIGSDQYNWFISQVGNSEGIFKIVMFHHPFVTGVSNAVVNGRLNEDMNWRFEQLGIDLVLNGHSHTAQHLISNSLNILDVSSSVNVLRDMSSSETIYGSEADNTKLIWGYANPGESGDRLYATIEIVGRSIISTVRRIDNANPVYAFAINK